MKTYNLAIVHNIFRLVAVMDWHWRNILSSRRSTTQDAVCCVEVVATARERYGRPEICNTERRNQFTSTAFCTGALRWICCGRGSRETQMALSAEME